MINAIKLGNFGPLSDVKWSKLGKINLVIGGNGSGKTFLLKSLYSSLRTLEEYKRGNDQRSASEILAEKLYWTFQAEKIGDLVKRGESSLSSCITIDGKDFSYGFGKDTTRQISAIENHVPPRPDNSIFLPAKEVLSLHQIILKSREQDKMFGFDDTYFDLAKALSIATSSGRNFAEFAKSREQLESILGGVIEYDDKSGRWTFVNTKRQKFQIGVTAEGIKKISILDTLLGNRYLNAKSVIFIDEPESALHPKAISELLDIVGMLAERGIQFFMASHSYFVIKKLYLIAQERGWSLPVISAVDGAWVCDDLKQGMPDNPIIAESINLYKQEVELALQ